MLLEYLECFLLKKEASHSYKLKLMIFYVFICFFYYLYATKLGFTVLYSYYRIYLGLFEILCLVIIERKERKCIL